MSAIEKLFVQIFDRKRQIIENLKHQKQLYDQHLLSKLLIQGIPPPPWLLNSDFQSSTSDLTALNKEELISGLLLPKPGPLASYSSGPCFLYDKPVLTVANSSIPDEDCTVKCASSNDIVEDEQPIVTVAHSSIPDEVCAVNCVPSNVIVEAEHGLALPCYVDDTEYTAGIVPLSHGDGFVDTSNYAPMSPEDQTDTRLSNAYKPEQSLVRIQRSRSRQKALEFRNSAKTSGKSRLGMENDVAISSGSKTCRHDEQLDGLRESLELAEPFESCTENFANKEVPITNSLNKERTADAGRDSLAQSTSSKAKVLRSGDSEIEKSSNIDGGRSTRSSSCREQPIGISSGSKTYRYCSNLDGSSGSLKLVKPSTLHTEISSNKAAVSGTCSHREICIDACIGSSTYSTVFEAKEVEMRNSQNIDEHMKLGSGNIQQAKIDTLENTKCRSDNDQSINADRAIGNTKAYSGKIKKSSIGGTEVEIENQGNRSRKDVSVKPKQLDFDEVEESNLGNISNCLSGTFCQGTSEERTEAHTIENSNSLPCVFSTEILEAPDSVIAHVLSKSDRISGHTLILPDCVGGLQASLDIEAAEIAQLSPGRTSAGLSVPVTDFAPVVTGNKVESVQSAEKMKLGSLSKSAASEVSTSSSYGKEFGSSKLPELGTDTNLLPDFNFSRAMDGSWPCYKRRKIEYKNPNKSASPTLRVNPFHVSNENIAKRSAGGKTESISPMSHNLTNSHYSSAALSSCAKGTDWSVNFSSIKEHVLTSQVQCQEDKVSLGSIVKGFICEPRQLCETDVPSVNQSTTAEPSDSLPEDGKVETNASSAVLCIGRESNSLVNGQDLVDDCTVVKLMDAKMDVDQGKSSQRLDELKFSIGSPLMEYMNVPEANQTMPEFEGFVISKNADDAENSGDEFVREDIPSQSNIMDRTSLPEKMSNSASLSTPVSPFPSACKLYLAPGIYSSVPNGLLENIDLQRNLLPSGSALLGKSHSDLFSFHMRKPFLSPSGKGFDGIISTSGGSDKLGSSKLELTCFPILEDPESSDEEVTDAVNTGVKRTDSAQKYSTKREPLIDIFVQNNSSLAPDHAVKRGSLESVSTDVKRTNSSRRSSGNKEPLIDITLQNANKKSGLGQRRTRQARSEKENKGLSVGANSSKKHSVRISSRSSKPKLSGKSSLRSRGESLSEKEQKANNIVSNISSFLPLVRQKQAASVVPEKRDVKVKALQAAEAAKRAAEKREIERKQKKEAMQLKRARTEQENMKEMELKKKLKEEERKKREAENAAKKRQREEEERREKEKKKKRLEEVRLQHKQAEEKLQAWREESRCVAEDERACQGKDSYEKIEKQVEGNEGYDSGKPVNDSAVVGNDRREADDGVTALIDHKMSTGSSATGKVGSIDMAESSTPNCDKNDKPIDQTSAQQSYEISPYQCSDDEEEEEDEIPNKKFVPTWASKNSVALALSSLQHMDPDVIFPPGSFCSLEEVLLPRRLPQK